MSEIITSDPLSAASEKPAHVRDNEIVQFPPFPDPTDDAFEDDISEEERDFYKRKFPDLNVVKDLKLHCSACDRHLGCSARNESRMRMHPMLRTLVCHTCHTFYNSGEFDKGEDGSELYCRWCGQGGQVYCCSDCPVVFCAKCIKRNFGMPKIREIENTDDWKCFKCNPKCLWDLRAVCWALLRYCDLRNKIAYQTQDPELKESYQKACAIDESTCCKAKNNKKKEKEAKKKDFIALKADVKAAANKAATAITAINAMTKIPPTIQVKKFASINIEESPPKEEKKKAIKRPAEKEQKAILLKHPIAVANRFINPVAVPPVPKKIRMPNMPMQMPAIRIPQKSFQSTYTRIRPKPPQVHLPAMTVLNNYLHNSNMANMHNMINNFTNDNINLSLENLTQGLDMSAVAGMSDQDVVCTPDFPLIEPLCEVTEDVNDDDVQCITPGPLVPPMPKNPPPLIPRHDTSSSDNIIQMTENDVTVNAATGGLKFRVDPQTLSSNKMYRLPDGRVFAINANPNMPGGYSATIVALTENNSSKSLPKGSTYAAKLSAVSTPQTPSPTLSKQNHTPTRGFPKRNSQRASNTTKTSDSSTSRICDLKIPVEWYRYNLIDAVDALEYSLSRLNKLKKEASTMFLRTRNLEEMRSLHKTLDSMLKTSSCRFNEIRDNLNKEMKQYVQKKKSADNDSDDDDDDVEILNDINEDPIFIDENSMESNNANETNCNTTAEVDLTGPASSDHNDSGEKSSEKGQKEPFDHCDLICNEISPEKGKDEDTSEKQLFENNSNGLLEKLLQNEPGKDDIIQAKVTDICEEDMNGDIENIDTKQNDNEAVNKNDESNDDYTNNDEDNVKTEKDTVEESRQMDSEDNEDVTKKDEDDGNKDDTKKDEDECNKTGTKRDEGIIKSEGNIQDNDVGNTKVGNNNANEENIQDADMSDDKIQDTDMTEELIDSLLKEDNGGDDSESANISCMDIPEDFPEP